MLLRVILALWVTSESSESMIKKYVTVFWKTKLLLAASR